MLARRTTANLYLGEGVKEKGDEGMKIHIEYDDFGEYVEILEEE